MLKTRFTEMLDLTYPVMSAPMTMHVGGRLAAAVSKAGGLGSIGGLHPVQRAAWVRDEVAKIRADTNQPYAVGFITAFIPPMADCFDATLEARPPVVAFSFGAPGEYIKRARDAGAKIMCQVQDLRSAREAVDAGADILVAQGNEAGGHTGTMNLLPLLCEILDRHSNVPVLAAGGISSGRALATVLAAGADGIWSGTAFLATEECVEVPEGFKKLIVESDGEDTVYTRVYDVLSPFPWPEGIAERVHVNALTSEWTGREEELKTRQEELGIDPMALRMNFDPGMSPVGYGQGAAAVTAVRPAAEVLQSICEEAEHLLRTRPASLLRSS
jgi:nitronate monooxygenase